MNEKMDTNFKGTIKKIFVEMIGENEENEKYSIREATPEDAEEMILYLNQVGKESDNLMHGKDGFHAPIEGVRRRLAMFSDSDNSIVIVAVMNSKIIARAELDGYPNMRMHHRAKFSISVKKDYWNKGIGTAMINTILMSAKIMQLKSIELEVLADNFAGIALYKKMGFETIGTYKNFWYVNETYKDALIMQKCLD